MWKKDDVLPLKKCMFMGIETRCPNNPLAILKSYYGENLYPSTVCVEGKWRKYKNRDGTRQRKTMTRGKKNMNRKDLLDVFKILLKHNSATNAHSRDGSNSTTDVHSRDGSNRRNRRKNRKDFKHLFRTLLENTSTTDG